MSARTTIRTRCPACRAKYRLQAEAVGRKARCVRCRTAFQVRDIEEEQRLHPPTEDDILRWLMEDVEGDDDIAVRPRIVGEPAPAPVSVAETPVLRDPGDSMMDAGAPEETPAPAAAGRPRRQIKGPARLDQEASSPNAGWRERILPFRKTG